MDVVREWAFALGRCVGIKVKVLYKLSNLFVILFALDADF